MKKIICSLIIACQLTACASYENRAVSFRPPQDYINYQDVSGVMVGSEAFSDEKRAEETFGFDIRRSGILPVQVVLDNNSGQGVEIVSGQTFLVDTTNAYWKILSNGEAVERVERATQGGAIAGGAGKGAAYGAAAGALLGLAIGIVSGRRVGEAVVKGGVLGGAGGAVIGGASQADNDRERGYRIAEDIREKGIEGKIIPAGSLASGFIFFPGEAPTARELRLQVRFRGSGRHETISLRYR
ncbi:MAG: glycine zipper family protein [Desulfuromonadales bacterium]|nr:glycine zipper family protein [Desulfuromonadales bacterium]